MLGWSFSRNHDELVKTGDALSWTLRVQNKNSTATTVSVIPDKPFFFEHNNLDWTVGAAAYVAGAAGSGVDEYDLEPSGTVTLVITATAPSTADIALRPTATLTEVLDETISVRSDPAAEADIPNPVVLISANATYVNSLTTRDLSVRDLHEVSQWGEADPRTKSRALDGIAMGLTQDGYQASVNILRDPNSTFGNVRSNRTVGQGNDDTDAINDMIAAYDSGDGCTVVVPPGTYYVEGTVRVSTNQSLQLMGGAVLARPSGTNNPYPVVRFHGSRGRVFGDGLIKTSDASPHGIVKFGSEEFTYSTRSAVANSTAVITDSSAPFGTANVGDSISIQAESGGAWTNTTILTVDSTTQVTLNTTIGFTGNAHAMWLDGTQRSVVAAQLRNVRIEGVKATGNYGVLMQSAPQATGFGTYGNLVGDTWIRNVGSAVFIDAQANANMVRGVFGYQIHNNFCYFRSSDECQWQGGFLQLSSGSTMVRLEDCFGSSIMGMCGEPGGTSYMFDVDAKCSQNLIQMTENVSHSGTDLGSQTTIWTRNRIKFGVATMGFYGTTAIAQPSTNANIYTTGLASGA